MPPESPVPTGPTNWGIDVNELVKTTRDDLPPLRAALKSALQRWPAAPE